MASSAVKDFGGATRILKKGHHLTIDESIHRTKETGRHLSQCFCKETSPNGSMKMSDKSFEIFSLPIPSHSNTIYRIEQNGLWDANPPCWKDLSLPKDLLNKETLASILPFIYLSKIPTPLPLRLLTSAKLSNYQVLSSFKQNMQKDLESYLYGCWWNWKANIWHWTTISLMPCLIKFIQIPHAVALSKTFVSQFFQKSEGWFLVTRVLLQTLWCMII